METEQQAPSPSKQPRRLWQRVRRSILLYVIVPYVSVVVIFAVFQRRLMYQPTVANSLPIAAADSDPDFGKDVELKTSDGNTLRGWLLFGKDRSGQRVADAPLVLYFPGNSLNRHERINDLREVAARGFDVLIFDYRGFGDSTGSPTESNLSADAVLAWNYARNELGYDEERIVVFGESLGGAVALSLWSRENPSPPHPAAVMLNSTFASMPQTVAWHYPWFPFQFLLLDRWPSSERIARVDVPVIVFHGTEDGIIPLAHGRTLAQALPSAKFIEIPGGTHNEIPMVRLRQELDAILATLAPADGSGLRQ
jgi:fermentation-respiration switch protein FrsA (DUF1100 family)